MILCLMLTLLLQATHTQSLELVDLDCKAIFHCVERECHGALAKLTPENCKKVMHSEDLGVNVTNPGCEEVVVTAIPHNTETTRAGRGLESSTSCMTATGPMSFRKVHEHAERGSS